MNLFPSRASRRRSKRRLGSFDSAPHKGSGSVLLEVVLALALFVAAATIISSGINSSIQSAERVRLQSHAVNLAISLLSEMHMRVRPVAAIGPENFPPPFQNWTYRIEMAPPENAMDGPDALRPVEVVVRHTQENIVQRLAELFPAREISDGETNSIAGNP